MPYHSTIGYVLSIAMSQERWGGVAPQTAEESVRRVSLAAIPLIIITLDLDVIPLVVSAIMKGKPFLFSVSVSN